METVKIWQHEWFYITEPRGANSAATPEFRSRPPMWLASWINKGLDWGSSDEVLMLQKRIKNMIEKNTSLTDVIQVMLFRRTFPTSAGLSTCGSSIRKGRGPCSDSSVRRTK